MSVLVTGAAGFIGYHVAAAYLARGEDVVGLDNLNDYYDVALKQSRLSLLEPQPGFRFVRADLADRAAIDAVFADRRFDRVVHLGAQAGVRYSISHPQAYIDSNVTGTLNIIENCVRSSVPHLVFASSSSVYGANARMPFSEHHSTEHPVSLYAATKKSNELMAHVYASLHGLPVTGLRFFTVYGPWGRPDMAPFLFTRKIIAGEPIDLFNRGDHLRDFTYIDDIVDGVVRSADKVPGANAAWSGEAPDPATSRAPYRIYNIGNAQPVQLLHFVECLESSLGRKAKKNLREMQPGDVHATFADVSDLAADTGFSPKVSIEHGVARFVDWYRDYYGVT